jgi:hypothetical protein
MARDREFDERSSRRQAELDGWAQKLDLREAEHFKHVTAREVELAAREKRVADDQAAAAADREAAKKLKDEMSRRLKIMEGAA